MLDLSVSAPVCYLVLSRTLNRYPALLIDISMADTSQYLRERRPKRATGDDVTDTSDVSESELRKVKTRDSARKLKKEDAYSPVLDIFRVLTFLFLASCGLSYLISGGESFTWGLKNPPKYLQKGWWEQQLVRRHTPCLNHAHTDNSSSAAPST
jgi:predicted transcriptional regulator